MGQHNKHHQELDVLIIGVGKFANNSDQSNRIELIVKAAGHCSYLLYTLIS